MEEKRREYWLMSRGKAFTRKAAYQERELGTNLGGEEGRGGGKGRREGEEEGEEGRGGGKGRREGEEGRGGGKGRREGEEEGEEGRGGGKGRREGEEGRGGSGGAKEWDGGEGGWERREEELHELLTEVHV